MMRIIPLICTILVVARAAPHPGSYSSANHYQFQRSSSSYRNNELQHKEEEAGAYGRIEDPDKYDKPLEQSHYRQSAYHAPGTAPNDDTEEQASIGIKGGRPNSYLAPGHSANFHRGYFGHDYKPDNSFYQFGGRGHEHHHSPGHRHQYEGHGYHHNYHHGFTAQQESSSQSSVSSVYTNQNKDDDQLVSLDQTFDYSKFKDQGFGKEYLENTEGQRVTTPRSIVSTTENIRPVYETTEEIPEQPGFSSQMGNNGRTIGQGQGQISQQTQHQEDLSVFGMNSQQGQQGQQEHVVHEDQTSTGLFGSAAAHVEDKDDNQQQIDIGQSFLQGETSQNGQSTFEQNTQQGQSNIGQVSQQEQSTNGQTLRPESQTVQDYLKPMFDQIDQINRDQTHSGSFHHNYNYESGRQYNSNSNSNHHQGIHHHTTGYIKPKHESSFDEPDCVHTHEDKPTVDWAKMEVGSHHKEEKTEEKVEEMTTEQSFQEATTKASQQENNNMEMMNQENQNEMSQGNLETMTEMAPTTTEYYYHQIADYNDSDEDLTQQTQHFDHHHDHGYQQSNDKLWTDEYDGQQQQQEDLTQHFDHHHGYQQSNDKLWKDEYDGQQQEDLTQQTQDAFGRIEFDGQGKDLTQQQEDGWSQFEIGNHEDLTQKQEKQDEAYGHLEFGAQQQEDLSQKSEDFGTYYGRNSNYNQEFATEVQDVSQQVQKVQNLNLEEQKETAFEPEEIAVVTEEKTTQKPGFWKRLGGSISRTYETAKEKVKNNLG